MKIGIFTQRCYKNYGGIFQCLALQNILKANKHDVEVIDFAYRGKNRIMLGKKYGTHNSFWKDNSCF